MTSHKDYLQLLKDKAEFLARILLDYKKQLRQDRLLNASMYQKVKHFKRKCAVLVTPHTSFLQTGTTRF